MISRKSMIFGLLLVLATPAWAAVCSVGDTAEVLWKGTWYPAKVTRVNEDQTRCFIRYTGYGSEWDEWVGEDRIRIKGAAAPSASFSVGDAVSVKWKGSWYPASVLEVKGGKYKIHYDGYSDSWDEWVGPSRIRARYPPLISQGTGTLPVPSFFAQAKPNRFTSHPFTTWVRVR